jgi:demethylspheroidene O-methyltransferase
VTFICVRFYLQYEIAIADWAFGCAAARATVAVKGNLVQQFYDTSTKQRGGQQPAQQARTITQVSGRLAAIAAPTHATWSDRLFAARDRLLASASFQRWAAAFPLTRPTARRHARDLFDLCAGFVYSQILLACVQVKLFDVLADGPLDPRDIAARTGLTVPAVSRLVRAAESLGLVAERSGGRVGLAMKGAALRGNPGALVMIEHHALLYADLVDPVALLRGEQRNTELSRYWPYASAAAASELGSSEVSAYTNLMAQSQTLIADDIISAYPFARHKRLLDVGGGDGSFLAALGARVPDLRLQLFDLPAVASRAAARFAEDQPDAAVAHRVEVVGGDFSTDDLPRGADVVSLVRVILDHTDQGAIKILSAIRRVLPDNGVLIIAEPMRGLAGVEPVGDAYFGFYLLAMGRGEARSPEQLKALLVAAGFDRVKTVSTRRPILTGMMMAQPSLRNE